MEIKEQANLYPQPEDRTRETQARGEDRRQLWAALRRAGFTLPESMPSTLSSEMVGMVYQFLAQTPSRLLMVQLEDLLGELDTPNLPGAADSAYPSWRVRLSRELTSWLKDPANAGFSQVVSRERRRRRVPALTRLTKK
jgi:4-alpha-glucanotransferase